MSRLAREIADEAVMRMVSEGMPPMLSMRKFFESIIAAKLEPVRKRLQESYFSASYHYDLRVAVEAALAMLSEEDE